MLRHPAMTMTESAARLAGRCTHWSSGCARSAAPSAVITFGPTLEVLAESIPFMVHEVPTSTQILDRPVPNEWKGRSSGSFGTTGAASMSARMGSCNSGARASTRLSADESRPYKQLAEFCVVNLSDGVLNLAQISERTVCCSMRLPRRFARSGLLKA